MDDGLTANNPCIGCTDLHLFELYKTPQPCFTIELTKPEEKKHKQLIQTSQKIYQLHQNINKEKSLEMRQQEQNEYNGFQGK
jgi:hypothetical protein